MLDGTASGGWSWVIASYALTWATLSVYTVYVMGRRARAERDSAAVHAMAPAAPDARTSH